MDRRAFLASGVMVALAGCLGYQVVQDEELTDRDERIAALEDDLVAAESALAEAKETAENKERELASIRADLEDAREYGVSNEIDVLGTWYAAVYARSIETNDRYNVAWSEFGAENYLTASLIAEEVRGRFGDNATGFGDLSAACTERGYDSAGSAAGEMETLLGYLADAALHLGIASLQFYFGDEEAGTAELAEFEAAQEAADAISFTEPNQFVGLLEDTHE